MPRVPTIDNFGVQPNQLPGVQVRPVQPRVDPGQQLQQLGQQVERAGAKVMDFENEELRLANQLRVDDALNKALEAEQRLTFDSQAGFTNQKGLAALERGSGVPLADEYSRELGKEYESIASTLGNNWQRQAFQANTQKRMAAFRGAAMRHEAEEFRTYALSVREGTIANRMNQIGLSYNDPAIIDEAVTSIRAATYDIARLQGKSAEWSEAQARKMTSNAHKVALGTAIERNDITFAAALLDRYASQMEPDDIHHVSGLITKEMDLHVGVEAATEHMAKLAPRIVTGPTDQLVNVVMGLESGGRRYGADGKILEGPATRFGTAKGEMQVIDATSKNPGLGVTPAKDDSPEELARVGRDYLGALTQRYKGDVPKVLAAYNWGLGNVDRAVERAGGDWLTLAPAETKAYVEKGAAAFGTGAGVAARPSLLEAKQALRADPRLAGNPARLRAAEQEADRQFSEIEKVRKQAEEEGTANALRALLDNGGDFKALSPTTRAMIPVKDLDNVMGFADRVRKGEDKTSEALYQKLSTDPAYLTGLSDNAFYALRRELSESDFRHFASERGRALGRPVTGANGAGELNTAAIREGLSMRLQQLGIDPTPRDKSDAARIGGIRQFVDTYIATAQREAGKKFNDVEVAQQLDALFAKNATLRGLFRDTSGRMLSMKGGDVPSDAKDGIRAAFKRRGVDDPTEAQILNAYWTARSATK